MCDLLFGADPLSGSLATLVCFPNPLLAVGRILSGHQRQVSNAYQVVDGGGEFEDPSHQLQAAMAGLTQQPNSFQPAEDFFYSFALPLTNLITRMARRAFIDGTPMARVVLG